MTVSDDSQVIQGLIRSAANGEDGAQDAFLKAYWPVIEAAVRARKRNLGGALGNREETVDILQDAALRVVRDLGAHRWEGKSSFTAWIRKLAGFEVLDSMRRNRAQKRDALQDVYTVDTLLSSCDLEAKLDSRLQIQTLFENAQKLKEEHASAWLLNTMGFSYAEIAAAMGMSAEAVRKNVSRAKAKLLGNSKA